MRSARTKLVCAACPSTPGPDRLNVKSNPQTKLSRGLENRERETIQVTIAERSKTRRARFKRCDFARLVLSQDRADAPLLSCRSPQKKNSSRTAAPKTGDFLDACRSMTRPAGLRKPRLRASNPIRPTCAESTGGLPKRACLMADKVPHSGNPTGSDQCYHSDSGRGTLFGENHDPNMPRE